MTTLAHLSDIHLNGTHPRLARLMRALETAAAHHPDHLVITGDNTALGTDRQLQSLHQALSSWHTPYTLIAGNHDGRLKGFTSEATDFGDMLLIPVDTRASYKPLGFSALGRVGKAQMRAISTLTSSPDRPAVLAMHHGPQSHPLHVFDGLLDRHAIRDLLRQRPWVHVLCGHDHRCLDIGRVHVAPSVAHHPDPVRIYKVTGGVLHPVYRSEFQGAYFT
jgi:3',5'-cyclic AMP phosphodiesterase CpdA